MQDEKRKVVLSGVQPSGDLTIGNYIGAIKNWPQFQKDYDCFFMVADMHSITVPKDPKDLRKKTLDVLSLYLASDIDPEKSVVFIQSHVKEHAMLAWVLSTITYMGQLNRMTQYKEKSESGGENVNAGLFTYPILMASDIFLYHADLIPVGDDQKQHVELARDLAIRFNNKYSETFKIPEPFMAKKGTRIKSLQDPLKKMSKSCDDKNSFICVLDGKDKIHSKIKKAVTDSEGSIEYDKKRPGIYNLIEIYSAFSKIAPEDIVKKYQNIGYKEFKEDLSEVVYKELQPLQEKYFAIREDKEYLDKIIKEGAEKASYVANKTLRKVLKKVGFYSF